MSDETSPAAAKLAEQIAEVEEAQRRGITDGLQRLNNAAAGVGAALAGLTVKRGREYEDGPIHHANDGCPDHI